RGFDCVQSVLCFKLNLMISEVIPIRLKRSYIYLSILRKNTMPIGNAARCHAGNAKRHHLLTQSAQDPADRPDKRKPTRLPPHTLRKTYRCQNQGELPAQ